MKLCSPPSCAAFSLVEVTLALGIVGFCLLPLLGLLPIGIRNDQTAFEQTTANAILSAVASDLRSAPPGTSPGASTTTQEFKITIPAASSSSTTAPNLYFVENGTCYQIGDSRTSTARYLLTIQYLTNGSNAKSAILANVQLSWPAAVPVTQASGKVQLFVALNRN